MRIEHSRLPRTDHDARSEAMHTIAASHGGRSLSPEYCGVEVAARFECALGHRFLLAPKSLFRGGWCPTCRYRGPTKLAAMQALAAARGGACLADVYRPDPETMPFRCAEGHEWESTSERIKRGKWCPRCAGKRLTIADMQALAAKLGGRCVSKVYRGYDHMLEWVCGAGHRFRMRATSVRTGSWCLACAAEASVIDTALRRAASKGGALLTPDGLRADATATWGCTRGHAWEATPRSISRSGWCPTCWRELGYKPRLTIEEMQELARINLGRCLSTEYVNTDTKLQWECDKGHRWWSTPGTVKHGGAWCPDCGIEKQKQSRRANHKDRL